MKKIILAVAICLGFSQTARASAPLYLGCAVSSAIIACMAADEDEKAADTIARWAALTSVTSFISYLIFHEPAKKPVLVDRKTTYIPTTTHTCPNPKCTGTHTKVKTVLPVYS